MKMKFPYGYWNYDTCRLEALKYNNRTEFFNNSNRAYILSSRNGWLDDLCKHMILKHKPNNYWTKEKCLIEAKKYKTRSDFMKNNSSAYTISHKKGWLDEICQHMKILNNLHKRIVYVYEFSDNSAYIGLTYNLKRRHDNHLKDKRSSVFKHIKNSKLIPILISDNIYYDCHNAQQQEKEVIEKYIKNGWNILNKCKGGSLGLTREIYTFEKCMYEALKYKKMADFIKNSTSFYRKSKRSGWLDRLCSHMVKYTFEECMEEGLKYNSKTDFKVKSNSIYNFVLENDWLETVLSHIFNKYSKERCKEEAMKYTKKSLFKKNSYTYYKYTIKNKWYDILSHM